MKNILILLLLSSPVQPAIASHIFHLEKEKETCQWKLYDVTKKRDKKYFQTKTCPTQIVWLKDKSFYYSLGSEIFWANRWVRKPTPIVNLRSAKASHSRKSEVIWGVKGKYNSLYAMVTDPNVKRIPVNGKGMDRFSYQGHTLHESLFEGDPNEKKAAGVIKVWLKTKKTWKTESIKLVGRYSGHGFDKDLFNNSVLSSRQIVHYNECADYNCEEVPKTSFWDPNRFEKKLNIIDNGFESMGYLSLNKDKGVLFKKVLNDTLHSVKPFVLCNDNCEKMTEIELPKSFSDSYAMVKKGEHFLVTNENKGSIAGLYDFNSPKPIKKFRGPMVFWHPF